MIDFIDKTSEQDGTPVNRETLMAIQGFEPVTTVYNSDGSITKVNGLGQTLTTTFNANGITETFTGYKTITKTIYMSGGKVVVSIS